MARLPSRSGKAAATSIQASTRVAGRIEGSGDLDVFGTVEGSIVIDGNLLIDADGRADADVEAARLDIHGIYTGNAKAERIELFETAIVVGDLRAAQVIVADGAKFRGLIDMGEFAAAPDARASARGAKPARAATPARSTPIASKPASKTASKSAKAEPDDDDADS